jgi:niacin transporter
MRTAQSTTTLTPTTALPIGSARALSINGILLFAAAVLLPAVAHLTGMPVRVLLPMHWPVIFAGLVYGWRGGAIVGASAPAMSFLVSGMPLPAVLPAMTLELACYGALSGVLRQAARWSAPLATTTALVAGRLVFAIVMVLTFTAGAGAFSSYAAAALLPGLPAAVAQVILLPILARRWMRHEQGSARG